MPEVKITSAAEFMFGTGFDEIVMECAFRGVGWRCLEIVRRGRFVPTAWTTPFVRVVALFEDITAAHCARRTSDLASWTGRAVAGVC